MPFGKVIIVNRQLRCQRWRRFWQRDVEHRQIIDGDGRLIHRDNDTDRMPGVRTHRSGHRGAMKDPCPGLWIEVDGHNRRIHPMIARDTNGRDWMGETSPEE